MAQLGGRATHRDTGQREEWNERNLHVRGRATHFKTGRILKRRLPRIHLAESMMATSWLLPAVPTSTGVDTGALPTMDLEQAAWDASVIHVSTGTDTDGNSMAVVSVPGDEADGPTSTGEGAAGTTRTRTTKNDEGAASEQENSSSRLISVEASVDIVGGRPRTGTAEPSRANGSSEGAMGSSETNSEPINGTVAAASGVQVADSLGRIRTPVVWGQGIPLRPAMTIQSIGTAKKHQAIQTTSQVSGVQSSILTNILPGHASVTDAVTRLQKERDLALRRIDELHDYYKKEMERKSEADRKGNAISLELRKL